MLRVFVSSVSTDLEATRRQVIEDLQKSGYDVSAMERFGAQPSVPIDVCLREVRRSDVFVLLIGPRYGSLLPQGISYTQAEFREAQGAGIPVFAFRLADDKNLSDEERHHLASFATEVGSTTTYDSLTSGESLERISPKVLAALTKARDRGDIAHRFSVFQKYDRYLADQLGHSPSLFSHAGPFIGRDPQLERIATFLSGREPLFLLKAPGGSGKSRLLLEAARAAAQRPSAPQLFFVDSGASWSAEDINLLPQASTVLVFDDAHRRPDLDRIMAACRQHNDEIRYLVSCRPSAVGIVTPLIAPLLTGTDLPELDLPPLARKDAEALARHFLGESLQYLAARLVAIADSNPLVVRVGARCIADKLVLPEVLERTPEAFRRVVLDRLLDDPVLKTAQAVATRQILEVIATIGPVVTEDDELVTQLSNMVQLPDHDVRRLLATLERTGFLLRRGRLVRLSPDVLADHLLYVAAVDDSGKPTGFVDQMVTLFQSSLENILANAAELDWRSETTDGPASVLRAVWRDLLQLLPTTSNRERAELVKQLKRAAIFAPEEVLEICEWLTEHPKAANDELLAQWGLEDTAENLIDALTDVISLIATHPNFTRRCAAQLWLLGTRDDRPLKSFPNHAKRCLGDLVKYEPRTHWELLDGVQVKAIEFLIEQLSTSRDQTAPWAVSALAGALRRTGEANESNRRVFTLREFSLAAFSSQLTERRDSVVQCLVNIALGENLDEAATAVAELSSLVKAPRGPFGRSLKPEEEAVWQIEAEKAIALLLTIAETATSEVIRFLARRELRSTPQDHWPEIAPALRKALNESTAVPSEQLYDLLIGVPWAEQLHDLAAEETRVEHLCMAAGRAFWQEHSSPASLVEALLTAMMAFNNLGRNTESRAGELVRALVLGSPYDQRDFVQQLAAREPGWPFLRSALLAMHETNPELAEALVKEQCLSEHEAVRAAALDAVQWMVDRAAALPALIELTRTLSQDPAPVVRGASARVLRRLATHAHNEALTILTTIDWAGFLWLAEVVLGALDVQRGLNPDQLSDTSIDTLVTRIEQLRTLEGRNYEVLEFISYASKRRPTQTVEMLLRRVLAVEQHQEEKSAEQWLPMPYSGHGLSLPGVHGSASHLELVRLVRDATLDAGSSAQFWLPVLFHAVDPNLAVGRTALREWLRSGEPAKIVHVAGLLRGFAHSIVFSEHELIAELLVAAEHCGTVCLQNTKSELFVLAASGVYTGLPGQPTPRHLQDKADAERMAEAYAINAPARDFYLEVLAHAEGSIRMDVALWDDEGDDE